MSEFRGTTTNPDPRIYKYSINGEKATAEQVIKALEKELEQSDEQVQMQLIELQKLKEYTVHKSSCELVSLAFTNIPIEERKCTCGLNELLNQSK